MTSASCPRCGVLRDAPSAPCPACLLGDEASPMLGGRYRLDEEIGEGGMGVVFKAFDTRLQRVVAAKVAKGRLDDELKARFLREAQTLAALRHPSIVSALDVGQEDGELFIIMDFVEGAPLARFPVGSAETALGIALDLCDALDHAHARGVVHRDIKPENILIEADGRARLTDFGIARLIDVESRLTREGLVAGTPRYMAPAALRGDPPSPKHDLYSLGRVLRELLDRLPEHSRPATFERALSSATSSDESRHFASAREMSMALSATGLPRSVHRAEPREAFWTAELWLRPLAVLMALGTAAALWAFLASVTPRVISRADVGPLVMSKVRDLGDGRVVSPARFETGAWLMAVLFLTLAGALFAAWLTLLKHSREAAPDTPPAEGRLLFGLSLVNLTLWFAHVFLIGRESAGVFLQYMPIGGGLVEMVLLVLLWTAILESLRRKQNPLRNLWIWLGGVLMVVPPVLELLNYIRNWQP